MICLYDVQFERIGSSRENWKKKRDAPAREALWPTVIKWFLGNREMTCLIYGRDGKVS